MIHEHLFLLLTCYILFFPLDIVNAICDDENIKTVSFVGSDAVSFLQILICLLYPCIQAWGSLAVSVWLSCVVFILIIHILIIYHPGF